MTVSSIDYEAKRTKFSRIVLAMSFGFAIFILWLFAFRLPFGYNTFEDGVIYVIELFGPFFPLLILTWYAADYVMVEKYWIKKSDASVKNKNGVFRKLNAIFLIALGITVFGGFFAYFYIPTRIITADNYIVQKLFVLDCAFLWIGTPILAAHLLQRSVISTFWIPLGVRRGI
jgi:hypothetical protein